MANKLKPIRWTAEMIAGEFGINPRTVTKRLKTSGVLPGHDGAFSTADAAKAIFGDIQGEVLRRTREEALKLEIGNMKSMENLVEKTKVVQFCGGVGLVFRNKLLASSMTDGEKDEILADIHALFDAGTITEQICAA